MVVNVDQCFPKPKMMSSNVLFSPQPKDIQFILVSRREEAREYSYKWEEERSDFYLVLHEPVNQI